MIARTPHVLMIFPRFNPHSFWSFKGACEIWGARCPAPPLGLITLAAMLPSTWSIRLVNRNAEDVTEADFEWADLVMTGGMLTQQADTLALIDICKAKGKPVCIGGPDPTSSPHIYRHADFLVVGEAEGIIDTFIAAVEAGQTKGEFVSEKFQVDITKSPVPRFDLLKLKHYLFIGVQFSRGCPFNCEFCDIIELYGRVPRTKTNDQMLRELDTLYALGHRGHVDFVDDNLIGNKKALKRFLPALIKWQEARGYPFEFSTEASLNLADDAELLQLMRQTNFFAVFVGIESPDTETLISAQKKQNTRRSLEESVHKIYDAGMYVFAGFIVGFDTEKTLVSQGLIDCIEATNIPVCMIGLLTALPNTQLTRRLEQEGRLFPNYDRPKEGAGDQCTQGLNFVPLRPRRDVLQDYRDVLKRVYEPAAFFGRVRALGLRLNRPSFKSASFSWRRFAHDMRVLFRLSWRMTVLQPRVARHFWGAFIACARANPSALEYAVMNMVLYLHLRPFSRFVIRDLDRQIGQIDAGKLLEQIPLAIRIAPSKLDELVTIA